MGRFIPQAGRPIRAGRTLAPTRRHPNAQACGWLKDRFGVSWQVVPRAIIELIGDAKSPRSERAFKAMLGMKKLDLAALRRAYEG